MAFGREIGDRGEALARELLEKKGMLFVAANWACKTGEFDLVMRDKEEDCLVFVEVRTRRPTLYGEGSDTVAKNKQRKLIRTAKYYMQKENYWDDVRFDVVSIVDDGVGKPDIEHIEYAFDVSG